LGFSVQLVSLDLANINLTLTDDLLLHHFGMLPGLELPLGNRALVQVKGRDIRSSRAAVRQ